MASGIEEILTTLYEMVQDAWSLPLGADKCVLERDKVLDLLDEISNQLPGELKQAKTIVDSRSEVITSAKRDAEAIRKQAQQDAKRMASEEAVYLEAKAQAEELVRSAENKVRELKQVTNEFVDDALKNTERAISDALNDIRESRSKFRALVSPSPNKTPRSSRISKKLIPNEVHTPVRFVGLFLPHFSGKSPRFRHPPGTPHPVRRTHQRRPCVWVRRQTRCCAAAA